MVLLIEMAMSAGNMPSTHNGATVTTMTMSCHPRCVAPAVGAKRQPPSQMLHCRKTISSRRLHSNSLMWSSKPFGGPKTRRSSQQWHRLCHQSLLQLLHQLILCQLLSQWSQWWSHLWHLLSRPGALTPTLEQQT